jgi:hypothetical protein
VRPASYLSATAGFPANDAIDLGSPVGIENYDQATFKSNGEVLGAAVEFVGAYPTLHGKQEGEIEGPIPVAD